ncbi:MAG: winged helix-turn-helix domain-containing protein [Nanoarchaeota archaeon]|nr:winged helix-turn-helix domain-containing protein [Nanoarchaeota archaeon]MBU1855244.1 winged helix-turn-helix domain-containing protein [Nanoarchaeota archaeon]
MVYGELLTESRWNIIKELSKEKQTPTELAKKTGTSIANVSQQLRLLEAYKLVKREKRIFENKPGKPKTLFSIGKEIIHLTYISKEKSEKKELELDFIQKAIINLWLNVNKEDVYFLEKFFVLNEALINKCQAAAITKTNHEQIELLIITKDVNEVREKYSNQTITNLEGKHKKVVCWSHTIEEIEQGLNNKEEYYTTLTSNMKSFLDKESIMEKIREIKEK